MIIKKHICFSKEKAPELVAFLQQNNITYTDTHGLFTLDIAQNSPYWPTVYGHVENRHLTCLSETEFSTQELADACWLSVRSKWRFGYPQPERQFRYQSITYDDKQFCNECGTGLHQTAPFQLKALPKWGNRHLMMLNWVEDELFIDDIAKNALCEQAVSGCGFNEILNAKGSTVLPGGYQLSVLQTSHPGFIEDQISIQNVYICPICGCIKYHPSGMGMYRFKEIALADMPDICKTTEVFGWGKSAHKLILIRQKVYQLLVNNHLDRGLVFTPLELTSD